MPRTARRAVDRALATALVIPLLAACGAGPAPSTLPSDGSTAAAPSTSGTPASGMPASNTSSSSTVSAVAPESAPPGDIPDNLAFVRYTNQPGHYSFTHPEGWAQTGSGAAVTFTDKLNGVQVNGTTAAQAPTPASARSTEIPRLQGSVPAFQLRSVSTVALPGGPAVKIVFRRNSDPDSVTGKVYRDEVEEYLVYRSGHLVRMDLFGPVGADNVDAYATMAKSLVIR